MKEITITEGLCELKTLTNRINSKTAGITFIGSHQSGKTVTGFATNDDFTSKVKSDFESVKALIAERNKIKSAIVNSNATTKVIIGTKDYTVAEAIERKNSISYEKELLLKMVQQCQYVLAGVDRANKEVQNKLDVVINTTFGKDSKVDADQIKSLTDNYMKLNEVKIIDPLNVKDKIDKMSDDIDTFLKDVDIQLSISNATTKIKF